MKYYINNHKLLILILTLALCLTLFTNSAHAKANATLNKIKGIVNVFKPDKTEGLKGKSGMQVFVRDKIVTIGKDSFADINFPNGDVVRIMPDSNLVIKTSDFKKKTSRVRLKLFAGKVFSVVRKFTKGSTYEIETRISVAGVRGTIWSAEITGAEDPKKETTTVFMVKEGKVAVTNPVVAPKEEIIVSDLKKTVVKADKAPSKPVPLTPEEIAMFDILDDIFLEIKEDLRDEIKESIAEDILDQAIGSP